MRNPYALAHTILGKIESEEFSDMDGIQIQGSGSYVAFVSQNDYFEYEISVPSSGTYAVDYRVASKWGSTSGFSLVLDGSTVVVPQQSIPSTGDWESWTTVSSTIDLVQGNHILRFAVAGGGFNIDWFDIHSV